MILRYVLQLVLYVPALCVRLLIVRGGLKREGVRIERGAGVVLYANHQSMLDPIVMCASLPISVLVRLLPFHFFVSNEYLRGVGGWLLRLAGGFPAHRDGARAYGLARATELLAAGRTVVIFPQGERTREQVAKSGVAVLAHSSASPLLIPVHIDWRGRWSCSVHVASAFRADKKTFARAEDFMQVVYEL